MNIHRNRVASFTEKYRTVLIITILLITTLSIYWRVLDYEFINYDDDVYVTANKYVQRGLTTENLKWMFTTTYANFWHPLTWFSFMLDYQLFGPKPGMFHFINLLFHVLNTLLLFFVLKLMTKNVWKSAVVAALFSLHPLHVESVAWISQRKDVLSTLFWILTMWGYYVYIKNPDIKRYFIGIFCFTLGLMAKPMLVTLPFVLFLLDFWPFSRVNLQPSSTKNFFSKNSRLFYEKVPYFAITFIFSVVTFIAQRSGENKQVFINFSFYTRVANAIVSYFRYIKKLILPFNLTLHYPLPGAPSIWLVLFSGALLITISAFAIIKAKKYPYLVVGWLWFLGTLVPVIGLVQVGLHAMADRYSYISLIGLFIIIAWGVPDLFAQWRYRNIGVSILAAMMFCFFTATTWVQISYWKNSITVFEHAIKVTDNNYVAYNNLANALVEEKRLDEAIYHYQEAIRLNPGDAQAINNLGYALAKMGKMNEAIHYYSKALQLFPDYPLALYNIGDALLSQGNIDEFVNRYSKAMGIKQDTFYTYKTLGDILFKKGKVNEAIILYYKALNSNPYSEEAHTNLGIALIRDGELAEAIPHFRKAANLNSNNLMTQENLKRILAIQDKMNHEIIITKNELNRFPNDPKLHLKLGYLYKNIGKKAKAITQFKKSISLDSSDSIIHFEIATLYAQQNNINESIRWLKKAITKGYNNWSHIKSHRDLAVVRKSSRYKELIGKH